MKTKLAIFVLLLICKVIYGQDIELGFKVESQGVQLEYSNNYRTFSYSIIPTGLQVTFAIYPIENIAVEARGGGVYFDNYIGGEYGLFSKYFIFKNFYANAGLAIHFNSGGGTHNLGGRLDPKIILPSIGFGLQPFNHLGIEFLFQKANNQSISYSDPIDPKESQVLENVNWILKLGIVFSWKL